MAQPASIPAFLGALLALSALGTGACAGRALRPASGPTPEAATPGPGAGPAPAATAARRAPLQLALVATRVVPLGQPLPGDLGFRVGGLSGCTPEESTGRTLVVSDDRDQPRVFDLDIHVEGDGLSVAVAAVVRIQDREAGAPGPQLIDMEGIALAGPGAWLISSEGRQDRSAPVPPAITRHGLDGALLGRFVVPDAFLPAPAGADPRGVPANQAFESLTRTPDGRVVTASEGPLAQDGAAPGFGESASVRLLEYVPQAATWRPGRQFAYALSPVALPDGFGPSTLSTGVSELLALDDDRFLVLERSYVAERAGARRGVSVVRLFEVSLRDADDVSGLWSLRDRAVRPLAKRLVLDLGTLAPRLAVELPTLENFEAMCRGPRLPDGSATLLLISDNNFHLGQKTAFLLFRMG